MANGNVNGDRTTAEKISNNVYSIVIARFILPALITLVGWFATTALSDLKSSVKEAGNAIESMDRRVTSTFYEFDKRINLLEIDQRNLALQRHQ